LANTKRLRVFAGPNGSGKTTLAKKLIENGEFKASAFVNADNIEREIRDNGSLDFGIFGIHLNITRVIDFFSNHGMSPLKLNDKDIPHRFLLKNNSLIYSGNINSYIASDLAAFIREELLSESKSFWFETVFSHSSKLEIMQKAKELNYRIYFYYIATDSPEINVDRVNIRVAKNGHSVPKDKIISRYYKSLDLLLDAVKISDRAFLFDNSEKASKYVCEITDGRKVTMKTEDIPNWFINYIYNKNCNYSELKL